MLRPVGNTVFMRILVTFAVEAEFAPWRKRHSFVPVSMPTPIGLQDHFFYRGTVFENDADVLLTGIGWEESNAANRPRYVLRELLKNKPDLCISSGLAGGLRADLRCGDTVAAREVLLQTGGDTFRSSANLLALAKDAGARIDMKQITETHMVCEASAKSALSKFGDFVDMEGYHILQIVSGTRIPVISVRAISDTLDLDLPSEIDKVVNREGHVQVIPLLKLIMKRPGQIGPLLSFGAQSRDAAINLADFLDRFLEVAGGNSSEAQAKREAVAAR
jgi:nucleoside phosphorylase